MLAIAGQTTEPNWLTLRKLMGTQGVILKKIRFYFFEFFFIFDFFLNPRAPLCTSTSLK